MVFGKKSQGPKLATDVLAHEKGKVFTEMKFTIPKSLRGHLVTLSDGDASSLPVVDVVVTRASKRQKIAKTEPQAETSVKMEPQEPKTQHQAETQAETSVKIEPQAETSVKTEPQADTTSGAEGPASAHTVPDHGESGGVAAAANPLMLCNDDDDL